jgi:NDP-sugar pyrophosphorylase family protein
MLRVCGRPVLEHNVSLLVRHGIRDIWINLHHCPDTITEHFGSGRRFGASIHYSLEDELLGTAGALRAIRHAVKDTFVVVYGDNLTDCNLTRLLEAHRRADADFTMALYRREDVSSSGMVLLSDDDRIVGFIEKPQAARHQSHWVNAGLLVVEPKIIAMIPEGRSSDFGFDILPKVILNGWRVFGYKMSNREHLQWIDCVDDYERVQRMAKEDGMWLIDATPREDNKPLCAPRSDLETGAKLCDPRDESVK